MISARLPLAVAAVAFAGAAPAAGAPPWSQPQTVSRAHSFVHSPALGFTANGTALASWSWQDGVGNRSTQGSSTAARSSSGTMFGPERPLPDGLAAGPAPYGSDRVLLVRIVDRTARTGRETLRVQFGDVSGRFGRPRTVARRSGISRPRLSVNARGDAALAWFEDRGTGNDRVYLSLRRAGGEFGRPIRLAQERIRNVSVAVGPGGDVLVAWDARGRIRTRFRGRRDRGFGPADTLRSRDTFFAAIGCGVAADGRAWVAWTAQFLSEGGDRGDAFVQAALRPGGARRFRPALLLAHGPGSATPTPVSLALDGAGNATLAWMMWSAGTTVVQAARVTASGAPRVEEVTRFQAIDPVDAATVAVGRGGGAVVTWTQLTDPAAGTSRLYASVPASGGGWGAPELVSEGLQAQTPVAAYPPAGGAPLVLFINRPQRVLTGTVAQVAARE